MERKNPRIWHAKTAFVLLAFALAFGVVPALADGTSRSVTTPTLKMTGLRGLVPASTKRAATTPQLKMTGLRGLVPASTKRAATTAKLKMTGLRP